MRRMLALVFWMLCSGNDAHQRSLILDLLLQGEIINYNL